MSPYAKFSIPNNMGIHILELRGLEFPIPKCVNYPFCISTKLLRLNYF